MSKMIHLDYGHGGKDPGALGNGLQEKDLTMQIGKKIKVILEKHNVKVSTSRDVDKYLTLTERANIANRNNVDIFASIHINSFKEERANGVETFSHNRSVEGAKVAKMVQDELVKANLFKSNRGTKTANFTVLAKTKAPAILTELGFISNKEDSVIMTTRQNELAEAVAKGLLQALSIRYKGASKVEVVAPNPQSIMRYGSRGKEVTKLQKDLNKLGYDVSIQGAYGREVVKAVETFQSRHVGVRRSGEVDETTLRMIEEDLKAVDYYIENTK